MNYVSQPEATRFLYGYVVRKNISRPRQLLWPLEAPSFSEEVGRAIDIEYNKRLDR